MINTEEYNRLRERAMELRRAGKSRREIKQILGIAANSTITDILRGEPPPPWTGRPNAKDDLRERARELRVQGLDYAEIAGALHVSKSSVSLWVRDLPRPERQARVRSDREVRERSESMRRYWAAERAVREAKRVATSTSAAAQIGSLTDREILIAGAVAYWCEGAKNKPYRRDDHVSFINNDPALITFFMRFLRIAGIGPEDLIFRVYIHERADIEGAERYWLALTSADPGQFRSPVLKHHNPKTVRKNTGDNYHGCLRIDVRRGGELYRKIEGWASAAMGVPAHTAGAQALPARF